ncbi:hypothetical protein ACEZCY_04635 [Streptacidiphilus sp. N1-12]|uniref:Uncharacterized protein n=2 Tax=Streptacidiphilus alkalitolerans TaxID=3342712 RepID=A0ABV6W8Z0_9ACTN
MHEDAPPSREDEVNLYMATLQARMDPEQFRALAKLLVAAGTPENGDRGTFAAEVDEEDEELLSPAVMEEFLVVMGIINTGRMDQQVVDLGHGVMTVVTEDIATDPDQMRELRAWAADHPEDPHEPWTTEDPES